MPALLLTLTLVLAACTAVPPTPTASPVPVTATSAPEPPPPTATDAAATPTPAPPAPSTDSLVQLVQSGLPQGAFEGVAVLQLAVPAGQPPLWAVYSVGMRNFDLAPLPNHFVAIYTQANGNWQELARQEFSSDDPTVAAPDYVGDGGLAQVQIEPSHTWLALEGGAGAHSGVFELLDFDGQTLHVQVNGFSSSPGVGTIQDVNGDGVPDVVLDATDYYVFCYACGVARTGFQVFAWDQANGRMLERADPADADGAVGSSRSRPDQRGGCAGRGGAVAGCAGCDHPGQTGFGRCPAALHQRHGGLGLRPDQAERRRRGAAVANSGYPLLSNVFYGDYAAAVDLMRPYSAAQIFSAQTPLVVGTTAETWVPELTGAITQSATSALTLKPDLAPAYFLRGWASYLADPVANRAQAKADVAKAAALAPADALYRDAAAFLAGGSN